MISYLIRSVAAMAVLVGTVTSSAAAGGSFTRGCAARDMEILLMLERYDDGNGTATQEVNELLTTLFNARMVCFSGRVVDALEIYENVARRLTSARVFSGRIN
jgi:hypothetical protein